MAYSKPVPPIVAQDRNKSECWAAALASWLQVTPGRPKLNKQKLIDKYSDLEDDGVSEDTIAQTIVPDFNMQFARQRAGLLAPEWLEFKLRNNGYVVLVYKSGQQSSHTINVYGIEQDGAGWYVRCMDPWYGSQWTRRLSEFNNIPKLAMYPWG
jgi:hypothetical protein